jgi:phytoene dehydrogenase-like protein
VTGPAVIIGDGVDEQVAARYLARAGMTVHMVREGATALAHLPAIGWIPPRIARDLAISAPATSKDERWLSLVLPEGGRLELTHDVARAAEAIRQLSARDAGRWPQFCTRMRVLSRALEKLYEAPPPDPLANTAADALQLVRAALGVRSLGRQGLEDLLRLIPMSIADLLDDWFESAVLKGALAALGVTNLAQGPRSGGTALNFLHHHAGCETGVFRQPVRDLSDAFTARAGMETADAHAIEIRVKRGVVASVALSDGRELAAAIVMSGTDPKRTLLELVDPGWLDPALTRAVRHIRSRGVTALVKLTFERDPGFTTLAAAATPDALERAYDDSKYGAVSREPYVEFRYVGVNTAGTHDVQAHVQYVPYRLRDAVWDAQQEERLARVAIGALQTVAPGIAESIRVESVVSPLALEVHHGLPEAQPYHAELALDQFLWMRPAPELARYRTPIGGLYLCGPAMHPGAGVLGAAGMHAAHAVMRDVKASRKS